MPGKADDALRSCGNVAAALVRRFQSLILGLVVVSSLAIIASGPGLAEASRPEAKVDFNIPAQPIASALDIYSAVTGREIFYDGALAKGRRSSTVQGSLAPEEALRSLLVGTGLVARATGRASFMLAPSSHAGGVAYQPYFAMLQTKVSRALCGHAETRPRDADLLLRIWVAPSGIVQRAQLLDQPDDHAGEESFDAVLRGMPVGAPPADMPQPVMMAILARNAGGSTGCSDSTAAGSR
jgi:hypothetical protein